MTKVASLTARSVQATETDLAETTAQVLTLYNAMGELVQTEDYKVLQAAAQHLRNQEREAEIRDLVDSDDEGDDDEAGTDDEDDETREIDVDFKDQLDAIKKMDKGQLKLHVQQADKKFSLQFRKVAMQVYDLLPGNEIPPAFSGRLLDIINDKLSDADKRIAVSPISLQLETGEATNDELSRLAIAWTFNSVLHQNKWKFNEALKPLNRLYLADRVYNHLTAILKEEAPEHHEDLRLGDLAQAAIDLIVLPFQDQVESDSFLADTWKIRSQKDMMRTLRLEQFMLSDVRMYNNDVPFVRRNILDLATAGEFSDRVMALLAPIVKDNTTEVVYGCWAVMLHDLVDTIARCVSDAREVINPRAAGRLVAKSESHALRSEMSASLADD